MKIFCLIASLLLSFISTSQKSYYFSDPLPSVKSRVDRVDTRWYGTYKSDGGGFSYEINEKGVPCFTGSCSEVYLEKAFTNTSMRPNVRLPVAKILGETAIMSANAKCGFISMLLQSLVITGKKLSLP